ncbi:MAG: hypothetical protein GY847_15395 [Proteobacteria bacterium]|nr:hypothetical protein [Pseudomonadota bacterium]
MRSATVPLSDTDPPLLRDEPDDLDAPPHPEMKARDNTDTTKKKEWVNSTRMI